MSRLLRSQVTSDESTHEFCYSCLRGFKKKSNETREDVKQLKVHQKYCSRFPFKTRNVISVSYGTETLSFMGPKIWALIPSDLKNVKSLPEFKRKIKLWRPDKCPCRMCKTYISGLRFVEVS